MPMLRRLARLALVVLVSLPFLPAGVLVNVVFSRAERVRLWFQAFLSVLWMSLARRSFGISVSVEGELRPGAFIASNHVSYVDILVIGSLCPSVFVSKQDVRGWPLMGWLARLGGTIFIERELKVAAARALGKVERSLEYNVSVVVFPEGTTSDGTYLRPFKPMFFEVPAHADVPVVPVAISYRMKDGSENIVPWHGGMTFAPHLWRLLASRGAVAIVKFLPPIYAKDLKDEAIEPRRALAEKCREKIWNALTRQR
jgi:lyso-ornithine lipid O-acyltransferase